LIQKFENTINYAFKEYNLIALVPDRYDQKLSIKDAERSRREDSHTDSNEIIIRDADAML